jgi:hypothetical protein
MAGGITMKLTMEEILDISQYAFVRMDGAWFLALAKKYGIDAAWEMDVEAWKQLSYLLGKKIRKNYIPAPVWPGSFLDALEVFSTILKIEGRSISIEGDSIIIRATDCETQKAIAKAGIADCGIVTIETYQNLVKGLFGDDIKIDTVHTKNLNRGANCCEVIVTRK